MMGLIQRLFDYQNQNSVVNRMRKKRASHFYVFLNDLIVGQNSFKILDIGGSYHYWRTVGCLDSSFYHVTLLNIQKAFLPPDATGFSSIKGDARSEEDIDLSRYDLIFSNSTLEHLGSLKAMKKLADYVCSSEKPYYIQTPSFWFPLEPHCRIPFFQFLPRALRGWLIWHFRVNYFPKGASREECLEVADSTILLTRKQVQKLFPNADIMVERMMGFPKSYTAFWSRSSQKG